MKKIQKEDAAAVACNNVGGGHIAGIGDTAVAGTKKKRKKGLLLRHIIKRV